MGDSDRNIKRGKCNYQLSKESAIKKVSDTNNTASGPDCTPNSIGYYMDDSETESVFSDQHSHPDYNEFDYNEINRYSQPNADGIATPASSIKSHSEDYCITQPSTRPEGSSFSLTHRTSQKSQYEETRLFGYRNGYGQTINESVSRDGTLKSQISRILYFVLVQAGLIFFVITIMGISHRNNGTEFIWHPILVTMMLVAATEGIVVLQYAQWPAPPRTRRPCRIIHIIFLCAAVSSGTGGIIVGITKLHKLGITEHWCSSHARLGIFIIIMCIFQFIFGISILFAPRLYGGHGYAKQWYKFHRLLGYINLASMWICAWLGIHTDWAAGPNESHMYWGWFVLYIFLIIGVIFQIDFAKLGFK